MQTARQRHFVDFFRQVTSDFSMTAEKFRPVFSCHDEMHSTKTCHLYMAYLERKTPLLAGA